MPLNLPFLSQVATSRPSILDWAPENSQAQNPPPVSSPPSRCVTPYPPADDRLPNSQCHPQRNTLQTPDYTPTKPSPGSSHRPRPPHPVSPTRMIPAKHTHMVSSDGVPKWAVVIGTHGSTENGTSTIDVLQTLIDTTAYPYGNQTMEAWRIDCYAEGDCSSFPPGGGRSRYEPSVVSIDRLLK
jgi:hypothetical protein